MIEFSVIAGVLIFCIGIIVEYGRGYREYANLAEAARIAARNTAGYQNPDVGPAHTICEHIEAQTRAALASLGANPNRYGIRLQKVDINDSDLMNSYRELTSVGRFPKLVRSRINDTNVYGFLLTLQRLNPERGSFLTSLAFPKSARALFYVESKKDVSEAGGGPCAALH